VFTTERSCSCIFCPRFTFTPSSCDSLGAFAISSRTPTTRPRFKHTKCATAASRARRSRAKSASGNDSRQRMRRKACWEAAISEAPSRIGPIRWESTWDSKASQAKQTTPASQQQKGNTFWRLSRLPRRRGPVVVHNIGIRRVNASTPGPGPGRSLRLRAWQPVTEPSATRSATQ